jgi:catechol 2,3-dioxygenase-like lactoylglutathione lyase family enzyme
MITAVHTLVYADDAQAARAFFRDVLNWPYVDAHDGWLIFRTGPSELGVHPGGGPGAQHEISLMCDNLAETMAELSAKGASFSGDVETASFGRTVKLRIPGAGDMVLYEPRHPEAYNL